VHITGDDDFKEAVFMDTVLIGGLMSPLVFGKHNQAHAAATAESQFHLNPLMNATSVLKTHDVLPPHAM
jgi:hypothetical protein